MTRIDSPVLSATYLVIRGGCSARPPIMQARFTRQRVPKERLVETSLLHVRSGRNTLRYATPITIKSGLTIFVHRAKSRASTSEQTSFSCSPLGLRCRTDQYGPC
jgi:hypothetical protein